MKTNWRKVGNEWRRGALRVMGAHERYYGECMTGFGHWTQLGDHPTPEAAMKAADRWAAKMLRALKKMEGVK